MITLTINGEEKQLEEQCSLTALLQSLAIDPDMVVIEYNKTVVMKDKFDQLVCQDNDQIEIAQFMGGG